MTIQLSLREARRIFTVACLVLEEPDPALALPEDKQWSAGIYGKSREISGVLRDGIAESLVLLSVYGVELFMGRLAEPHPLNHQRLGSESRWARRFVEAASVGCR